MTEFAYRNVSALEFVHNILCGISALSAEQETDDLVNNWKFFDEKSSTAAVAAYQYLRLHPDYNLSFAIYCDPIYGQSDVWEDGVQFEWQFGNIQSLTVPTAHRAKVFFVDPYYYTPLNSLLSPEEERVWKDCAWVFANAYGKFDD